MSNTNSQTLEVDPALSSWSETDFSDYESGFESDLTSLTSSAKNHTYENGRRYHGYREGKYVLPNDEKEKDRQDLQHHVCQLALGGELLLAPLDNPQRILDVGTGTGIWAIEVADLFPQAQVIGVDLSPIQPSWIPPNLSFEVDDVEEPWHYPLESFDLIHVASMAGFLNNYEKLMDQCMKFLRPGGYVEFQEWSDYFHTDDGSLPKDSTLTKWIETWEKGAELSGRKWQAVAPGLMAGLEDRGFKEVREHIVKVPNGMWPKKTDAKTLGMYMRQQYLDGAEGITLALFTRVLGWKKEEVDTFLVDLNKDLKNPKYHTYGRMFTVYGKKPLAAPAPVA